MNSGKLLLGVLAGVAIGATLGVLFAPDKGSVTRRKMAQKGSKYADDLEEKFNHFIDEITEQFENLKDETINAAENIEAEVEKETGHTTGPVSGNV